MARFAGGRHRKNVDFWSGRNKKTPWPFQSPTNCCMTIVLIVVGFGVLGSLWPDAAGGLLVAIALGVLLVAAVAWFLWFFAATRWSWTLWQGMQQHKLHRELSCSALLVIILFVGILVHAI